MKKNEQIPSHIMSIIQKWMGPDYDAKTHKEIENLLKNNPEELIDAFSKTLTFGTGGMRELMGVGPNRMNKYTIYSATQGLANYLKRKKQQSQIISVVIGYDSRKHSQEFAIEAGRCLAGNGIKVYITSELRPTPYVSFATRQTKSLAAIMITASHNPPEYNGFKVYGKDGAQVVAPEDSEIIDEVKKIQDVSQIALSDENDPLIEFISDEMDEAYLQKIRKLQIHPKDNEAYGKNLKILYSSLHGAGITLMQDALKSWHFTKLQLVKEQCVVDEDFPTAKKPNPEERQALAMGIEQMKEQKHDIFLATDPDADRIGVVAMHKGTPYIFSGNQIACLCLFHILSSFKEGGILPRNGGVITTIVTTPLFKKIAQHFAVDCFEVLTGFKYIGQMIHQWEKGVDAHNFLFGAEESYGFLFGTHSRDKDAIIIGCLLSEMASLLKEQNQTLVDLLNYLYKTFGIYKEAQETVEFAAYEKEKMDQLLEQLRRNPPKEFNGIAIKNIEDLLDDRNRPSHLPKANVLMIHFEDGYKLIIRPSGTEPKIKIYGMGNKDYIEDVDKELEEVSNKLSTLLYSCRQYCLGH